jgi:hypothetical protein
MNHLDLNAKIDLSELTHQQQVERMAALEARGPTETGEQQKARQDAAAEKEAKRLARLNDSIEVSHAEIIKLQPSLTQPVIEWGEIDRFSDKLPPVPTFNLNILPEPLRPWAQDASERMDAAPVDYIAISAICSLGTLIGRKVVICPKEYDYWKAVPNLWGAAVGVPSAMKTPTIEEGDEATISHGTTSLRGLRASDKGTRHRQQSKPDNDQSSRSPSSS